MAAAPGAHVAATIAASAQPPDIGVRIQPLRIGHRLRDLLPEEVAITLAEPVNGDFERAFRCAHFSSECGVRRLGLIEQEDLQPVEMVQTSMLTNSARSLSTTLSSTESAQRRSKIRSGVSLCAGSR